MSTDSTELTFVRCPSCRSLVPASQTRCRMCGASLDAGAKADETDKAADSRTPRVKQRTMSQPKSELASALGQLREEHSTPASASKSAAPAAMPPGGDEHGEPLDDLPADDPLSAYIEEVDSDGSEVAPSGETASDIDDFDDLMEEVPPVADRAAPTNGVQAESVDAVDRADETPKSAPGETPKSEARVVVESGRRPSTGGLSFSKGKEPRSDKPVQDTRHFDQGSARPAKQQAREQREPERTLAKSSGAREAAERPRSTTPAAMAAPGVKGRLFGWLVSYADPDGSAIELREGRFFVSGSSLKPSDLVLDHPSISTPHALVKISAEAGFQIQDLMSEGGLFVRRRNQDSYQREETSVVQHGDWLRLGEMEYLVSLVAHVGVK